ncbi:hypothetical protein CC78DRAFT_566434 [Lojkania enalia]|uniref:BZIP domain-containing protein n=1 Tax=Lojkania enalia TaxID=147567 RepID=A0A9P4KD23_9PLEO|nr:hypothetical protein CC78DRAFT_566434 [Didymosphaeria enalia]
MIEHMGISQQFTAACSETEYWGRETLPSPLLCRLHADTLDPNAKQASLSTQPPTSESSLVEPLNYSPASRLSSSSLATIPTFDFTSFTTASQQSTWHPSPAPQASRQLLQSHTEFAAPQTDFVLYDQPAQVSQRPQRQPSAPHLAHTFNSAHFYANSAPSSTTELQQPQLQQRQQRPPVPLFSSFSNNITQPQQQNITMADLNSNNSFDSNMGAGLGPAYGSDSDWEFPASAFTSINDASATSGSTRTISPKDIFQDPFGSAPPSTAFTDLTSPEIGESPFIGESYETSPMFYGDAVAATDKWYSLFPEAEAESNIKPAQPADLERTVSQNSLARSSSSSNSPITLDSSNRRKSTTNSPALNASISKPRRRKGVLPPITVDPNDKAALKRARNTLAARDSRQRKFDHVQSLERRNAELEAEVEKWKNIAISQGYTES